MKNPKLSSCYRTASLLTFSLFGIIAHNTVLAQSASGQKVYEGTCMACHGAGVAGAPKYGDKKAWAKLIKEPQYELTAHGYVGVRGMPAKGGKNDLSIEDFSKAVVYMTKAVGSPWKEPDAKLLSNIKAEVVKREKELKDKATAAVAKGSANAPKK